MSSKMGKNVMVALLLATEQYYYQSTLLNLVISIASINAFISSSVCLKRRMI